MSRSTCINAKRIILIRANRKFLLYRANSRLIGCDLEFLAHRVFVFDDPKCLRSISSIQNEKNRL